MRVLLVEGNPAMRNALAQLLRAEAGGQRVDEAKNGAEALMLAHVSRPDLVLIQADLPVMSGIDVVRRLRAEYPDLCLIGMTLFENADKAEAMRAAGADAVVSKSEPDELVNAMRDCYTAYRARQRKAG